MKQLNINTLALSVALVGGSFAFSMAAPTAQESGRDNRSLSGEYSQRPFRGKKPFTVDAKVPELKKQTGNRPEKVMVDNPALTFDAIPTYDYLEGPDGSTWYYTVEYESTFIEHNEYWTEEVLDGFTFTIYDNSFNEVGKVKDKLTLNADLHETRCREVLLDAAVSTHFFNTDDNIEVMVFHVMNTEEYVNHYYYKVYSIGGEKDEDGNDVSIATFEGRCVDATNIGGLGASEDFYITFVQDPVTDRDGRSYWDYIDYLNEATLDLTTYKKATADNGPEVLMEKSIYLTRMPGDTTDGVYLIVKEQNGQLYLVYNQYAKPYFIMPVLPTDSDGDITSDEGATADNALVIETYKVTDGEANLMTTTTIPVEAPDVSESLYYAFYSIGAVSWTSDVDMTYNGIPDAPAFVVSHDVQEANSEDTLSSYEIYSNDGKLLKTIATGIESIDLFDDGMADEPHCMFIKVDEDGNYVFEFRGLYSGETVTNISQYNDGDQLTASCARVKIGDTYMYAFELLDYLADEDDNTYIRMGWFNADGTLERIDNVNLGQGVQYAVFNMDPAGLKPDVYDEDDEQEYAVLVKRTHGSTIREEFVVVDDDGKIYGDFTADDERGDPFLFTLLTGEKNRLMMVYSAENGNRYNVDVYDLPFLNSSYTGVEEIAASEVSGLSYDGSNVYAQDCTIEIFSMTGVKAVSGKNSVSVAELAKGVYVVVATDANGKKHTAKISI